MSRVSLDHLDDETLSGLAKMSNCKQRALGQTGATCRCLSASFHISSQKLGPYIFCANIIRPTTSGGQYVAAEGCKSRPPPLLLC